MDSDIATIQEAISMAVKDGWKMWGSRAYRFEKGLPMFKIAEGEYTPVSPLDIFFDLEFARHLFGEDFEDHLGKLAIRANRTEYVREFLDQHREAINE